MNDQLTDENAVPRDTEGSDDHGSHPLPAAEESTSRDGDQPAPTLTDPPVTGDDRVDAILADVGELSADPAQAQEQLAAAHAALQEIIQRGGQ